MQNYAITAFAASLENQQLTHVSQLVAAHGMEIASSYRLERERVAPAWRIHATRTLPLRDDERTTLLDAAEPLGVDLFVQTVEEAHTGPRLFVFDMDSTLIKAEVIDELAALAGVGEQVSSITARAMRGELDFRHALMERVALLAGLQESRISELHDRIAFSPGVEALMNGLHVAGCITVVVSGGFGFFARRAQQRLQFQNLFCNELEILDGTLTGRTVGPILDAQGKRAALLEVAQREGIPLRQVAAVGDGANDIPMLSEAAIGIAYRAKPLVKAAARFRLTFAPLDSLLHLLG